MQKCGHWRPLNDFGGHLEQKNSFEAFCSFFTFLSPQNMQILQILVMGDPQMKVGGIWDEMAVFSVSHTVRYISKVGTKKDVFQRKCLQHN